MAQVTTTLSAVTYSLLMSREEALVVKALVGNIIGVSRSRDVATDIWCALDATDLGLVTYESYDFPRLKDSVEFRK